MATCPDCGEAMLTERPHRHPRSYHEAGTCVPISDLAFMAATGRAPRRSLRARVAAAIRRWLP